jgi:hypothetical protein
MGAYEPRTKQSENSLKKARWLGIAHLAGDAMTYFIETERDETNKRNVILVWSITKTRRKNIRTATEFVNDDPALAEFFLARPKLEISLVDEVTSLDVIPNAVDQSELHPVPEAPNKRSREAVDPREALPPVEADNELPLTPEEMEKL